MNEQRRLRVLVVDDHDLVHRACRVLFTSESWVERCVPASSGDEAVRLAKRYSPHVALIDLFLAQESGVELCERLREESEQTRVLLMSGVGNIAPPAAKAVGASGFVSKSCSGDDIASAARMVGIGMTVFPPESQRPQTVVSDREREVLSLLATGATNDEIATALYLSPHTIKDHTTALYRKMKARNRAEAVVRAQRLGLIA
jgi:DNA-binding NarL/FixJ family response regulator